MSSNTKKLEEKKFHPLKGKCDDGNYNLHYIKVTFVIKQSLKYWSIFLWKHENKMLKPS